MPSHVLIYPSFPTWMYAFQDTCICIFIVQYYICSCMQENSWARWWCTTCLHKFLLSSPSGVSVLFLFHVNNAKFLHNELQLFPLSETLFTIFLALTTVVKSPMTSQTSWYNSHCYSGVAFYHNSIIGFIQKFDLNLLKIWPSKAHSKLKYCIEF